MFRLLSRVALQNKAFLSQDTFLKIHTPDNFFQSSSPTHQLTHLAKFAQAEKGNAYPAFLKILIKTGYLDLAVKFYQTYSFYISPRFLIIMLFPNKRLPLRTNINTINQLAILIRINKPNIILLSKSFKHLSISFVITLFRECARE